MHIVSKSLSLYNTWSPSRRVLAPLVKTFIVAALCRVSWQRQATLARVVRWIWPGFRDA